MDLSTEVRAAVDHAVDAVERIVAQQLERDTPTLTKAFTKEESRW
jgi:hypothetical protein